MERKSLTREQYAKRTNGRVEGLRIALTVLIRSTQTKESMDEYVKHLSIVKRLVEDIIEEDSDQFDSEWYPNGTLEVLSGFIDQLSDAQPYNSE